MFEARTGPWGSQCLPLPWGPATLQASLIKLHSFSLKNTIKHPKHPRQHQLFQNLIEVANEVNSAKLVGPNEHFAPQTPLLQVHESLGRVEGQVAYLEPQKARDLDGILQEFHYLSVTLKLSIDKGPAHHLLRCHTTLGSRTPGQSWPFPKVLLVLPWRLDGQVREMSGVTASPSLVILDVDGQKRYPFESDKAGHAAMLFIADIFHGKDWNLITGALAGNRAGSGHCRNAWFCGSFSRGHTEGARLQRYLIIVNMLIIC